jgi:hypothetical protein
VEFNCFDFDPEPRVYKKQAIIVGTQPTVPEAARQNNITILNIISAPSYNELVITDVDWVALMLMTEEELSV